MKKLTLQTPIRYTDSYDGNDSLVVLLIFVAIGIIYYYYYKNRVKKK